MIVTFIKWLKSYGLYCYSSISWKYHTTRDFI